MTPAGLATALALLRYDVPKACKVFGRSKSTVYGWLDQAGDGPPDHVALAVSELVAGRLAEADAASFIKKCRTRRDGDRYERKS